MTLRPACREHIKISAAILDKIGGDRVWYDNPDFRHLFFDTGIPVLAMHPFRSISRRFQEVMPAFLTLWREGRV